MRTKYRPVTVVQSGHMIRRITNGSRVYWTLRVGDDRIRFTTLKDAKRFADGQPND